MSAKAIYTDAMLFGKFLQAVSIVNPNIIVTMDTRGMHLRAFDGESGVMAVLSIPASSMQSYETKGSNSFFLNSEIILPLFEEMDKKYSLSFAYSKKRRKANAIMTLYNNGDGIIREFVLKPSSKRNLESTIISSYRISSKISLKLSSESFKEAVEDVAEVAESIGIMIEGETIYLVGRGPDGEELKSKLEKAPHILYMRYPKSFRGIVSWYPASGLLKASQGGVNLSENVWLKLWKNSPIHISYCFSDVKLYYIVSPVSEAPLNIL